MKNLLTLMALFGAIDITNDKSLYIDQIKVL